MIVIVPSAYESSISFFQRYSDTNNGFHYPTAPKMAKKYVIKEHDFYHNILEVMESEEDSDAEESDNEREE